VAVFTFNIKNYDLGPLSRIGLMGLFFTILFSIIVLFFILRLERKEIEIAGRFIKDVKDIRESCLKDAAKQVFCKSGTAAAQKIFKNIKEGKYIFDDFKGFSFFKLLADGWAEFSSMDKKIEEKKKEVAKMTKGLSKFYEILSYFLVFVFSTSILLIMIDVIKIIF
jgi:hypothetical protein